MDHTAEVILSAIEPTDSALTYEERVVFHPYRYANTWTYNSDHITLPITSTRSAHIEIIPDANVLHDGTRITVQVVAYRIC